MPPPEAAALAEAAAAMGVHLDAVTADRLLQYRDLLARWNRVYNLTAVRDPAEMRVQHLLDSLSIVRPIDRWAQSRERPDLHLLDVGSGGGLPGVVLAIVRPDWRVVSVDTVAKKAGFVRQVALELGLPGLEAVHARVESLAPQAADLIVSRAFASLADFVGLTRPHLAEGGAWAAMKGRRPDDEIAALGNDTDVFHVEPLQVPGLDAERHLIWMRPPQKPGDSAIRSTPSLRPS